MLRIYFFIERIIKQLLERIIRLLWVHLRSLNVLHFEMVGATELQNVASRSPSMASLAYRTP
jgi:hypothetical protein